MPHATDVLALCKQQFDIATSVLQCARAEQGKPSAKAMRRTFGQPPEAIRVHLYRDSAAWCALPLCKAACYT